MDKVLALECVIMAIMAFCIFITWFGYSRDKKRRRDEKAKK